METTGEQKVHYNNERSHLNEKYQLKLNQYAQKQLHQ